MGDRRYRVLEIGSGNAPNARSHLLVDRDPWNDGERSRQEPVRRDGRPLVAADGVALPFASQSFDLVIALNVLEHTDDPGAFLDEMARVGRRGLVHVPTTFTERLLYRPFHTFTFTLDGGTLVIRRKNFPDVFGGLFDYLAHFDEDFLRFMARNRDLFNLAYEWDGAPSYRVEDYDVVNPSFGSFERTYAERPFAFRLAVSELLPSQIEGLLAKQPPRSWRSRVRSAARRLLPAALGRRA